MPNPDENASKSFADRLRALFGASVDPHIELERARSESDSRAADAARAPEPIADRYVHRGELARGGMGAILKVWDRDLKRALAMKVMLESSAGSTKTPSTERSLQLRRFLEEAQITGQLEHPGIVPVHEIGLDREGRLYFTMRLVKGRDLRAILDLVAQAKEGWTQTRALQVILKVCEAMAFAHEKGVIHRDLKPANIMVGRFGETYVMDWGLAKLVDLAPREPAAEDADPTRSIVRTDRAEITPGGDLHLVTLDGDVVGTPSYMAPEQAAGRTGLLGPRTDIYAVGAMLYHLLAARVPYVAPGESVAAATVLERVLAGPPPPVHALARHVPAELVAICEKAMAREPRARYASMLDMAQDLQAYLEGRVVRAYQVGAVAEFAKWVRRNRAAALGIAAALLMALGGLLGILSVQSSAHRALAAKNLDLERTNAELNQSNVALARAEQEARANAESARLEEHQARLRGYVARITAADAALSELEVQRAKKLLAECDESLRGWEWRHLSACTDTSLRVLFDAQTIERTTIASNADASRIAIVEPRVVHVLDLATGASLLDVVPQAPANCTALTRDGNLLAVGCDDGTVALWDVAARQARANLGEPRNLHAEGPSVKGIGCVAFDATGGRLAAGGDDRITRVWDLATGNPPIELQHESIVQAVAFRPDGAMIATGTLGNRIQLWDATGRPVAMLVGNESSGAGSETIAGYGGVLDLDFDPTGELLASGGADAKVRIWDLVLRAPRLVLPGSHAPIHCVRFSPDGRHVATSGHDATVRLWRADTGEIESEQQGHRGLVSAVAFGPGETLISSGDDGTVRLWARTASGPSTTVPGHVPLNVIALDPDGSRLVTGAYDGRLRFYDAHTGDPQRVVTCERTGETGPFRGVNGAAFTSDGRRCVAATPGAVFVYDASTSEPRLIRSIPHEAISSLTIGAGTRFATGSWMGVVTIWDVEAATPVRRWRAPEQITALSLGQDGEILATASSGRVRLWDVQTGEQRMEHAVPTTDIFSLALSPDGLEIFLAGLTGVMQVLDTDTGDVILDLSASQVHGLSAAYDPSGSRIAVGGVDGGLRLFDARTGDLLLLARMPSRSPISSVRFSRDGTRLAAGDWSGDVSILETETVAAREPRRQQAAVARAAARTVLYPLLDQGEKSADLVARFAADTLLRTEVKDAVVTLAALAPQATALDGEAWRTVLRADADPNAYRAARRKIEEAEHLLPGRSGTARTAALAHYRLGEYHAAASGALAHGVGAESDPAAASILAMANARLGRADRARGLLDRMHALVREPRWANDQDAQALAREADEVVTR